MLATDHDLDDLIFQAVCQAHADGVPIQAGKGPFYDKQLKKVFGIPHVHQSNICASVKHLLAAGVLLAEPTDEVRVSYGTERIKEYPVVRFLPA